MAGAYMFGWDATNKVWVKCLVNAEGKLIIDPSEIFENSPTDDEHGKAPDSDWAYDHAANVDAHHAQLHAASHQDGGGDEMSVAGLSGELIDAQTPKTHASSHEDGGADSITNLGGNVSFPDRSYFNIFRDNDFGISTDDSVKIPFNIVDVDNQDNYDTVNHRFIASQNGFYLLFARVRFESSVDGDICRGWFLKNGSDVFCGGYIINKDGQNDVISLSIGSYLTKDDYIEVYVINYNSPDIISGGKPNTQFSGCLIA